MNSIELVTHCYAVDYPHFSKLLAYQLSSLELYAAKDMVSIVVCYCPDDKNTCSVLDFFEEQTNVNINRIEMPPDTLGRRSIGRNKAAKKTKADVVWFVDCDYFFGKGCLEALTEFNWPNDVSLVFPQNCMISTSHAIGDVTISMMNSITIKDLPDHNYKPHQDRKAIGGLQIIKGSFANEFGYLDSHTKYHRPTKRPFHDTREDVAFRTVQCNSKGKMLAIELPNLFRIRHTTSALSDHIIN